MENIGSQPKLLTSLFAASFRKNLLINYPLTRHIAVPVQETINKILRPSLSITSGLQQVPEN
ncbi:Protein of unknown function [Cotesia congregata]|uniref:Uncharacterized protein n=1 Tax=Cotesia congregata TaxID=51543 RepID=A0A8J2H470_COTCN|nr:Protein of unknown function [Cotesia congregata]